MLINEQTALERFKEIEGICVDLQTEAPLERLRFFCSLALDDTDWNDVEVFFTALEKQIKDLQNV